MKGDIGFYLALVAAFGMGLHAIGYEPAYHIGYGAISIMSIAISATFFWLWWVRATPLALGMAFSWAGAASVMGWWWIYRVLGQPEVMLQNEVLFIFLSLYLVGAISHFRAIHQVLSLPRHTFWVPVGGAMGLSILIWMISL